ncbi:MAG: AraC family ligand binding domain-containing protein, partial [Propionicimonas sp.]|nr:AraC family ligand binding domain-containing protein [Propionicimonas sp.]
MNDSAAPLDGATGKRSHVVGAAMAKVGLAAPVTSQLLITGCGYYPRASGHGQSRPGGAPQAVVLLCSQGQGWAEVGGTRHRIGPRQALLLPRHQPHSYGADEFDPWTIWWLHLDGEQVPHLLRACGVTRQRPVVPVAALARCTALVAEVIDAVEADQTLAGLRAASGAAWHLLTSLA